MRIGIGYDIQPLVEGRILYFGGGEIPSNKGSLGHSDGDVLSHAICDALRGALGFGNIGEYDLKKSILLSFISASLWYLILVTSGKF